MKNSSHFNGQVNVDSDQPIHFYPNTPLDAEHYLRQYTQLHANNVTTNTTLVLGKYSFFGIFFVDFLIDNSGAFGFFTVFLLLPKFPDFLFFPGVFPKLYIFPPKAKICFQHVTGAYSITKVTSPFPRPCFPSWRRINST